MALENLSRNAKTLEETKAYYNEIKDKGNQKAKARLIEQLISKESLSWNEVTGKLAIGGNTLKSLEGAG